ncbi:MAG: hypothetical protein WA090_02105 [Candidatus Nanopelagicaceae bacterium]
MSTPRKLVLTAHQAGASTRQEIAALTHLDPGIVDLIVDAMIQSGELNRYMPRENCSFGGCLGCPLSSGCSL